MFPVVFLVMEVGSGEWRGGAWWAGSLFLLRFPPNFCRPFLRRNSSRLVIFNKIFDKTSEGVACIVMCVILASGTMM